MACQLSDARADMEVTDEIFFRIIGHLTKHGECDNPMVMECLEKIVDAEMQAIALDVILENLLKEGKSEKALLIAPRVIACTQRFSNLNCQTWSDLIRHFITNKH